MQAAVYRSFGGPIRIEKVPIPSLPDDDAILVQVKATGVCRSDWHGWKGHDGDVLAHGLPFVPGHEFSGIVVRKGSRISTLHVGDRVVAPFILSCGSCRCCRRDRPTVCLQQQQPGFTYWGSFAEYVVVPRADRNVCRLPPRVSFVQAAALGCRFTTAYRAVLQQGRLQAGETVVIMGCGGVGLSCVTMAKDASRIVAVDVSKEALDMARSLGATDVVLARGLTDEQVREKVMQILDGDEGADLSIDAAGFKSTCENAIHCTARGGRMVQVGLPLGHVAPEIPMAMVAGRELELIGSHGFAADALPDLLDRIAQGQLDPGRLVQREVSLREGARILERMDHESPLGITMITQLTESKL